MYFYFSTWTFYAKCLKYFCPCACIAALQGRKEHVRVPVCYPQEYPLVKTWLWPLVRHCTPYLPNEEATVPAGTGDFLFIYFFFIPSVNTKNRAHSMTSCHNVAAGLWVLSGHLCLCSIFWTCAGVCFNLVSQLPAVCLCMHTHLAPPLVGPYRGSGHIVQDRATWFLFFFLLLQVFLCVLWKETKAQAASLRGTSSFSLCLPTAQSRPVDSRGEAPAAQHRSLKQEGWRGNKAPSSWTIL